MRTRAVDDAIETRVEACTPEALARLLLPRCWPRLTPEDPKSAWVLHLAKRSASADTQRTALARYDRATSAILLEERRLDAGDEQAMAALVAALRAAGRDPGDGHWTHHRTPYAAGFERTAA